MRLPITGWSTTTRLLHGLHRHRELLQRVPICCSSSWISCAIGSSKCTSTGSVSTGRAGSSTTWTAFYLLRSRAAGPGGLPGEIDRRTVGHRSRRLPGRHLLRRSGPGGTASTGTRSAISGGHLAEYASRLTGSADLYEMFRGGGRGCSRSRTTKCTSMTWSPTTTRRRGVTTARGTAGRNSRPTTRAVMVLVAAGRSAISWRHSCCPRVFRSIAHGDEPAARNNNTYCQDSELTWGTTGRKWMQDLIQFTASVARSRRQHPPAP